MSGTGRREVCGKVEAAEEGEVEVDGEKSELSL